MRLDPQDEAALLVDYFASGAAREDRRFVRMASTRYQGKRTREGVVVEVVNMASGKRRVAPLRHVNYHSPDGFEWGYVGSGPADLALSILAHHLGETWVNGPYLRKLKMTQEAPLCWKFHQDFKRDVISTLDRDSWELTHTDVHNWLMKQEKAEE